MYMVIQFNPDNDVVELKEFLYQGKFRYVETSNLQELYEKYKAIREQAKAEATAPVETDNQKSINEEKIDNQSMDSENSENSNFKIPKNLSKSQECEKEDPIAHTQKLLAALGPRISNFSQKRTIDILREKIGSPKTDSSQPEPSDSLPKMTPKLSNPTIFPIPEPSESRESEKAKNRKRSHRRNSGDAENSKMEDSKVLEILKNLNMPESNSPGFEPIFPLKWTDGY
ncbi:hypothetical protein L5515_009548 [Caenorhabditis briggsae]|uniref:Uncharacterized protein n=1 Tax=Caenorhabditis briggsae TaxID=6238 RepID=A0AAE9JN64_CAEBR|nr:hypothetical protein L5515_009548 [Caenorhabditis briggsae]